MFRAFFADALAQGGALAIVDKRSGAIIGSSRFQHYEAANGGSVEIGWTFIARHLWGTGLNPELKRLMLEHAFRYVERVLFKIGANNVVSRAAMTKIGGRLTGEPWFEERAGRPSEHVMFEITREDSSAAPRRAPPRLASSPAAAGSGRRCRSRD